MQLPPILQGESRVRLIQGAIGGAILTIAIGFGYSGWVLGGKAQTMADQASSKAVVSVLAPICVDKFQRTAESKATLAQLKAIDSWKQDTFVVDGGWATFPGEKEPNRNVAEACAKMLGELK